MVTKHALTDFMCAPIKNKHSNFRVSSTTFLGNLLVAISPSNSNRDRLTTIIQKCLLHAGSNSYLHPVLINFFSHFLWMEALRPKLLPLGFNSPKEKHSDRKETARNCKSWNHRNEVRIQVYYQSWCPDSFSGHKITYKTPRSIFTQVLLSQSIAGTKNEMRCSNFENGTFQLLRAQTHETMCVIFYFRYVLIKPASWIPRMVHMRCFI